MNETLHRRHSDELRDSWQGRLLDRATGKMHRVVQSVLAHAYPDGIETLLRVIFPGFKSLALPFFVSAGRITATGAIVARVARTPTDVLNFDECPWLLVFKDEAEMTKEFRGLADALKLNDADRVQMFKVVKKWIVCDWRASVSGAELDDRLHS